MAWFIVFTASFAVAGDRDGVKDSVDACPQDVEDHDGFQDEDGCPDPDNDGDGIPDLVDSCPGFREDGNGYQDDDGCEDAAEAAFVEQQARETAMEADRLALIPEAWRPLHPRGRPAARRLPGPCRSVSSSQEEGGLVTTFVWNGDRLMSESSAWSEFAGEPTEPYGTKTYTYDASGRRIRVDEVEAHAAPGRREFVWNDDGTLRSEILFASDEPASSREYEYRDGRRVAGRDGDLRWSYASSPDGLLEVERIDDVVLFERQFDAEGHLVRETRRTSDPGGDEHTENTWRNGLLVEQVNRIGFNPDHFERRRTLTYDAYGNLLLEVVTFESGATTEVVSHEYDCW